METRPHSIPPASTPQRVFEAVAAVGVVACLASLIVYWKELPPRVPSHFGWDGRPDAVGPRGVLIAVAGIPILLYVFMTVLARFPWRLSYPQSESAQELQRQYSFARTSLAAVKAFMMGTAAWTLWRGIQTALGRADGVGAACVYVVLGCAIIIVAVQLRWARRTGRKAAVR